MRLPQHKFINQLFIVAPLISCLSGCLNLPFIKDFSSWNGEEELGSQVEIISLRVPEAGESFTVLDSESGNEIEIIIDEVYTAANGNLCSKFRSISSASGNTAPGLVCQKDPGKWEIVPAKFFGSF